MATLLIVDSLNCQFSAMEQVKLVVVDVRDAAAAAAVVVVVVFGVFECVQDHGRISILCDIFGVLLLTKL